MSYAIKVDTRMKGLLSQALSVTTRNLNNLSSPSIKQTKLNPNSLKTMVSPFLLFQKCIKQYSQVRLEDNTVLTAKQIQELQKKNTQLEEENLILKKRYFSSTSNSGK